jgi:hypothetical protein
MMDKYDELGGMSWSSSSSTRLLWKKGQVIGAFRRLFVKTTARIDVTAASSTPPPIPRDDDVLGSAVTPTPPFSCHFFSAVAPARAPSPW